MKLIERWKELRKARKAQRELERKTIQVAGRSGIVFCDEIGRPPIVLAREGK